MLTQDFLDFILLIWREKEGGVGYIWIVDDILGKVYYIRYAKQYNPAILDKRESEKELNEISHIFPLST